MRLQLKEGKVTWLPFLPIANPLYSAKLKNSYIFIGFLWRTAAYGILSCSVSYFKYVVINMNIPNPMDIPNHISSSDIIQALSRQRA
jgi:hypothetical protein